MFLDLLNPCRQVETVTSIDLEELWSLGIRGLLLDLDNTLLAWDQWVLSDEIQAWVQGARAAGFRVALVSNANWMRLETLALLLEVPYFSTALKPSRRGLKRALELFRLDAREAAMVGDQLFTDVLAGNRLGLFTILVVPLHLREQRWMRTVRWLESLLLRKLFERRPRSWPPAPGLPEREPPAR